MSKFEQKKKEVVEQVSKILYLLDDVTEDSFIPETNRQGDQLLTDEFLDFELLTKLKAQLSDFIAEEVPSKDYYDSGSC